MRYRANFKVVPAKFEVVKTLTERAIDIVNMDFSNRNPYSLSQREWSNYNIKINKLKTRLQKQTK